MLTTLAAALALSPILAPQQDTVAASPARNAIVVEVPDLT
jgi:hypothetical protein